MKQNFQVKELPSWMEGNSEFEAQTLSQAPKPSKKEQP
jgi:hypothetical protein